MEYDSKQNIEVLLVLVLFHWCGWFNFYFLPVSVGPVGNGDVARIVVFASTEDETASILGFGLEI